MKKQVMGNLFFPKPQSCSQAQVIEFIEAFNLGYYQNRDNLQHKVIAVQKEFKEIQSNQLLKISEIQAKMRTYFKENELYRNDELDEEHGLSLMHLSGLQDYLKGICNYLVKLDGFAKETDTTLRKLNTFKTQLEASKDETTPEATTQFAKTMKELNIKIDEVGNQKELILRQIQVMYNFLSKIPRDPIEMMNTPLFPEVKTRWDASYLLTQNFSDEQLELVADVVNDDIGLFKSK